MFLTLFIILAHGLPGNNQTTSPHPYSDAIHPSTVTSTDQVISPFQDTPLPWGPHHYQYSYCTEVAIFQQQNNQFVNLLHQIPFSV